MKDNIQNILIFFWVRLYINSWCLIVWYIFNSKQNREEKWVLLKSELSFLQNQSISIVNWNMDILIITYNLITLMDYG
jgi:hypothetical protein